MGRLQQFIGLVRRVRERKIVQWALAYLAGAWALLEVFELVGAQFGWALELRQGVTVVLGAGFFAVLVVAWYHGERGRQRVGVAEVVLLGALVGATVLLLLRLGPDDADPGDDPDAAGAPSVVRDRPAVAVLPFRNLSGDSIDRFFTDGIHEEIIARLSAVSGLDVIARTSVMRYRDHGSTAREIARDLNVDALVEGSVRRAGARVRIFAQLVEPETDVARWSGEWDRELRPDSIFEVQETIARGITTALDARLTRDEAERLAMRPTEDLQAYDYYLLGRERWRSRDPRALREALALFEAAVAQDPGYARAHAGMADVWAVMTWYDTVPPAETYPRARRAAERALALEPGLAEAHATLGLIAHEYDLDWDGAEAHLRRAIDLRPNYASAHHWYAILLSNRGRHQEAVRHGGRALDLDPFSTVIAGDVAAILWTAGRNEEALALLDEALTADPEPPPVVEFERATMLLYESRADRAAASLERWARLAGARDPRAIRVVAEAARDPGRTSEALGALAALEREGAADPIDLIPLYALLGDRRTALAAVEEAFTTRSPWLIWMGTLPWYDSLRAEPRFRTVMEDAGLPNGR